MPLEWRYTYSGSDNGDPNESLGGSMSATQLNSTAMNNLFDDVLASEASSGDTEYRCLVLYANGASYNSVKVYFDSDTSSSDTSIQIAWEGKNPSSPTTIADEDTAPDQTGWEETTFTFRDSSNKLDLGNMASGDKNYIWFKRVVNAGASTDPNDNTTIVVEYLEP